MVRQAVSEANGESSSFVSLGFFKFFLDYSCNKNSADYILIIELRSPERIVQAQVYFLVLKSESKYIINIGCCCSMLLKTLIMVQFDGMPLQDSKHSLDTKITKKSLEEIQFVNCYSLHFCAIKE